MSDLICAGATADPSSRPVVLFVDDDARLLQAVRETVRSHRYQIVTASSASMALRVLRAHSVAVVVADEVMPEISGLELLLVVAKEFPTVGRILLTGHATLELATRAINEARVRSFLQKPCDPAKLRTAIKECLAAPTSASGVLVVAAGNRAHDKEARSAPTGRPKAAAKDSGRDRDSATGLYTRRALEQMFRQQSTVFDKRPCCVIYADIDRLHLVNQAHGFEYGDLIIKSFADLLGSPLLPKSALAARASGDCFLITLPGCKPSTAKMIAARLKDRAARIAIDTPETSGATLDLSVSCGIAVVGDGADSFSKAISDAEMACRAAKDHGRNRVELADALDPSLMRRQQDVLAVGVLREALKKNQFFLYAQKIVSLRNPERPCSYELLTRLRNTAGSLESLGEYIRAAQRYQLLTQIDRRIAERGLAMLASYGMRLHRLDITMSINVTGQSVGDAAFMQFLAGALKRSGIPASHLMLELTEQAAVANVKRAGELLREVCRTGCRIALDDFGTGSNSLTSFKGLPVARLKIDGSFIRDVQKSRRSQASVRAIVQLAKSIGADTVGEFVETPGIAHSLRELGVDYGQGYAFGKPEPLEEVLKRLMQIEEPSVGLALSF